MSKKATKAKAGRRTKIDKLLKPEQKLGRREMEKVKGGADRLVGSGIRSSYSSSSGSGGSSEQIDRTRVD
jgi:hypothetical protein